MRIPTIERTRRDTILAGVRRLHVCNWQETRGTRLES